jgi:hypothetical protein
LRRELALFPHKYFAFCQEKRYIEDGNSPRKQLNSIKMMNRKVLFWPFLHSFGSDQGRAGGDAADGV